MPLATGVDLVVDCRRRRPVPPGWKALCGPTAATCSTALRPPPGRRRRPAAEGRPRHPAHGVVGPFGSSPRAGRWPGLQPVAVPQLAAQLQERLAGLLGAHHRGRDQAGDGRRLPVRRAPQGPRLAAEPACTGKLVVTDPLTPTHPGLGPQTLRPRASGKTGLRFSAHPPARPQASAPPPTQYLSCSRPEV